LGKRERKRPLGRPRHRMQDYIKIGIQEIWRGGPCTGFIGLKIKTSVDRSKVALVKIVVKYSCSKSNEMR
jgi:hypothetical protein